MHHCISHGEEYTQKTKIESYSNRSSLKEGILLILSSPKKITILLARCQHQYSFVLKSELYCVEYSSKVNSSWHSSLVPKEMASAEVLLRKSAVSKWVKSCYCCLLTA